MAADSIKRVNCVKVCFTDREYIDLGRISAAADRKVADMAWFLVRQSMYGMLSKPTQEIEGTNGDE